MSWVSLSACGAGFLLDLVFGDPVWLYHPVRMIGALVHFLEKAARRLCKGNPARLKAAGSVLWVVTVSVSGGVPALLLYGASFLHPAAVFALQTFWCYQLLAIKSLKTESMKVYARLKDGSLEEARKAVSMIVGRDTAVLDEAGVTRAAVETVAENTSDGVVAPLFYLILGGPVLGFIYKAVNTMDSMIGYRDEAYRELGFTAALADDAANYLPARISALLMILAAYFLGMDGKNAWHIFRRDRYRHSSPNSAQTESVCAGALDVRLGGDAWYFGKLHQKPWIGDDLRKIESEDIVRAVRLLYGTAFLALFFFGILRLGAALI